MPASRSVVVVASALASLVSLASVRSANADSAARSANAAAAPAPSAAAHSDIAPASASSTRGAAPSDAHLAQQRSERDERDEIARARLRNDGAWRRSWELALHPEARAPGWLGPSLSEQMLDELTVLGNELGAHLDTLSLELVSLRVDGRARRMRVGVAAGNARFLSLRVAGDVHFVGSGARVATAVELGIAGHKLELELPEVELSPTSYRGERGVEIRLPLIRRRF